MTTSSSQNTGVTNLEGGRLTSLDTSTARFDISMQLSIIRSGLRSKELAKVEVVTAETIGMETTTYVRNIYKYYAAYRLTLEVREE